MPQEKLNILIAHNCYRIMGGEDTVVNNEKKLFEDNGHKVFLYSRNNNEVEKFSLLRKIILPLTMIFSIRTYREVKECIQKSNIDVVCVHNTLLLISPSIYYAALRCGKPVIQTVHNFRLLCPNGLLYRDGNVCEECLGKGMMESLRYNCYRNSKAQTFMVISMLSIHRLIGTYKKIYYMCLTDFNREKLLKINRKKQIIVPKNVYVRPNYTDLNVPIMKFSEREEQYLYVGRLEESKGIWDVLKCFRKISNGKLLICGEGDLYDDCKAFVEKNHMENVCLMGKLEHDKVLELMGKSKAVFLPSKCYEGFPMTLVESFACGTPIIGSKMGNVGNLIQEHINGFKVSFESTQEIEEIFTMLDTRMSDNCRLYYEEKYSPRAAYREWKKIYNKIR